MSMSAHVIFFSFLGILPSASEVLAMQDTEMEVYEPPEPEPEPEPVEEEPEPEPEPARPAPRPQPQQAEEPPPAEEEAPPAEEIADFTGETMVGGGDSSWSSVVGSGGALKGPVGKIRSGKQPAPAPVKAAPKGPRVVPSKLLGRKVKPPAGVDFNALLKKHFPPRARQQGVEGKAKLRIRIMPSGRVGKMNILKEWPEGFEFGEACKRMLAESGTWEIALDKDGKPVATDVPYNCTFEVGY